MYAARNHHDADTDMTRRTWGSTVKEVERSTFWIEGTYHSRWRCSVIMLTLIVCPTVPRIWKNFKLSFIICFAAIMMMIVLASDAVPFEWQVPANYALTIPVCLVVGCHILLPVCPSCLAITASELTPRSLDRPEPLAHDLLVLIASHDGPHLIYRPFYSILGILYTSLLFVALCWDLVDACRYSVWDFVLCLSQTFLMCLPRRAVIINKWVWGRP